jgi:tRNA threonylcarbamoyl adenosine modification protein YeaZ
MRILALEFSSAQRSAAVVICGRDAKPQCVSETLETGERSTKAASLVESALAEAQVEREQIDRIAVGLGPGSYTGIRAAVAFVQGWQLASEIPLVGISSADCLAGEAHEAGLRGAVRVVIDAQQNEFYLAGYSLGEEMWQETEPLRLSSLGEAREAENRGGVMVGPEATRWFPNGRLLFPRAAILGQIGCRKEDFTPGDQLEPIYLRATTFVKAPKARFIPD